MGVIRRSRSKRREHIFVRGVAAIAEREVQVVERVVILATHRGAIVHLLWLRCIPALLEMIFHHFLEYLALRLYPQLQISLHLIEKQTEAQEQHNWVNHVGVHYINKQLRENLKLLAEASLHDVLNA